jgi:hypothetical protein
MSKNYSKELENLQARISLLSGKEKEAGEKKIKIVKTEITILDQIKEGSEYYKATVKKIENLLSWTPGQSVRSDTETLLQKVNRATGSETGTTFGGYKLLIVSPGKKIDNAVKDKISELLKKEGLEVFSADWFAPSVAKIPSGIFTTEDNFTTVDRVKLSALKDKKETDTDKEIDKETDKEAKTA